jgi:hypothetical protein
MYAAGTSPEYVAKNPDTIGTKPEDRIRQLQKSSWDEKMANYNEPPGWKYPHTQPQRQPVNAYNAAQMPPAPAQQQPQGSALEQYRQALLELQRLDPATHPTVIRALVQKIERLRSLVESQSVDQMEAERRQSSAPPMQPGQPQ